MRSEKKIDRLEDRLASIENLLYTLVSNSQSTNAHAASKEQTRGTQSPLNPSPGSISPTEADVPTPALFEGETGLNTQSDYVRDLLVQVVGEMPSVGQNADVQEALTALEELVGRQKLERGPTISTYQQSIDRSLEGTDPARLERPPWSVVRAAIDKATGCWPHSRTILTDFLT